MTLHPLVGHEDTRRALAAAHARGVLPAALLLVGPRGAGKRRLALWIARLRLCEEPGVDGPCGACRPCRLALALEHPDVHLYIPLTRPKGATRERLADKLEEARQDALAELRARPLEASVANELRGIYLAQVQSLRRAAVRRPSMSASQTFVVSDAELLVPQEASPEAANALLKLLEEPSEGTRFVLTSSEPGRLLATIRSRTVPVHVRPLPHADVAAFLESTAGFDASQAARAARLGEGCIGRALGFVPLGGDPPVLEAPRTRALELLEAALAAEHAARFEAALGYPPARARELVELFGFVEAWLRDLAAVAAEADRHVVAIEELPRLRTLVERGRIEPADVAAALPAVDRARELARGNVNPQLVMAGLMSELRAALRPARVPVAP